MTLTNQCEYRVKLVGLNIIILYIILNRAVHYSQLGIYRYTHVSSTLIVKLVLSNLFYTEGIEIAILLLTKDTTIKIMLLTYLLISQNLAMLSAWITCPCWFPEFMRGANITSE